MEFVNVDEAGHFRLNSDAKQYLYDTKGPLQIVSVVGRYRTGKSSLLNHLVGSSKFLTSSTVQAQTKGLGIHIFQECEKTVCLIDSEGFGSVQASKTHDTSIFALSMLVSSGCFFNNLGTITSQNLRDLRLAARVAGIITSCSKIGVSMPPIIWILRDFVLQLRDAHGFIMSSSEYLEECIDQSIQSNDKDDLASDIRSLFPSREAMTVPRPCDTEEDLQKMINIKPSFVDALKGIRKRMLNFPIKTRQNRPIDGRELCDLVEALCTTLNTNDTIPNMDDMWSSIVTKSIEHATVLAKETFRNETDIAMGVREAFDIFKYNLRQIEPTTDQIIELTLLLLSESDKLDKSRPMLLELQHSSKLYKEQMEEYKIQTLKDIGTWTERSQICEIKIKDMMMKALEDKSTIKNLETEQNTMKTQILNFESTETKHTEHIQERFRKIKNSRDVIQSSLDQVNGEKDQMISKYNDIKHQFESAKQKLLSFRKRNDSTESQITEMNREIRELKTDVEVWKTRYSDTIKRHTSQNITTNDTHMELLSVKAEVAYLRKTKIDQDSRVSTLIQENSVLKHDVKKLSLFKTTFD
jgi:hypothetical protein